MKDFLANRLMDKKILILGFGREGQSSYKLIRGYFPELLLTIADKRHEIQGIPEADRFVSLQLGEDYMNQLLSFDLIIKTPGISLQHMPEVAASGKITSQTDLFLQAYYRQVIGVTGTKGKSTTASLIHHILHQAGQEVLFVGNIGLPPFDIVNTLSQSTRIVFELSSHQLEFISRAPHISILLNLFQEHLDHYTSLQAYHLAKWNIASSQLPEDFFIYNAENADIFALLQKQKPLSQLIPYSLKPIVTYGIFPVKGEIVLNIAGVSTGLFRLDIPRAIPGDHNLMNAMAAAAACHLAGISAQEISGGISSFKGLPHRIEFVGVYDEVIYYNDSIATIPEATIEAIRTLRDVDTLILGGFDRGIDYTILVDYIADSSIRNLIFIGEAGRRIQAAMGQTDSLKKTFLVTDFEQVVNLARQHTAKGKICLLSPAAASYDMFRNFEERGEVYKNLVKS
jgi:UDP-N-acetylmuramoyl-L-alanine---L-glutamate ligase